MGASRQGGKIETLLLRPLTGDKWQSIRARIEEDGHTQNTPAQGASAGKGDENADPSRTAGLETEDASLYDVTQTLKTDGGVVLDAHRELRVKLYLGQVSGPINGRRLRAHRFAKGSCVFPCVLRVILTLPASASAAIRDRHSTCR